MAKVSWDSIFEELAKNNAAEYDRLNTPENRAKREARAKAEHEQGVRLGWWTEEGEPIEQPDENEEGEDDDDDE
jgi:hypothetical protein